MFQNADLLIPLLQQVYNSSHMLLLLDQLKTMPMYVDNKQVLDLKGFLEKWA